MFARNSGAGNGCANFKGAWKMRSFCKKNHAHKIPRFRGGGILVFFWGGIVPMLFFMGARIFLNDSRPA